VIATNSNNFQGAWSAGNYFSTITFSNAGETFMDGVYTRSNEFSVEDSFTASGGRSINYDDNDGFWYTNGDLYRNYGTSLNVGDWTTENGDQPSPTAVNSTSLRNVGSPTSTTVVAITDWEDQSENGNNATAPDTYPTFIASSINSKPAISFNNDGSFMQIPENNIGNDGNISIFVVLNYSAGAILLNKGDGATFAQTVWEITTSNGFGFVDNVESWNTVPISIPQDVPVLLEAFSNEGVSQIAYNGTNSGSPSTANGNFNSLSQYIGIGGGGTNGQSTTSLDARIAEIIIYNRSLNTSERQEVESYLSNRYAIGQPVKIAIFGAGTSPADSEYVWDGTTLVDGFRVYGGLSFTIKYDGGWKIYDSGNDEYLYASDDLITWTQVNGALPVPSSALSYSQSSYIQTIVLGGADLDQTGTYTWDGTTFIDGKPKYIGPRTTNNPNYPSPFDNNIYYSLSDSLYYLQGWKTNNEEMIGLSQSTDLVSNWSANEGSSEPTVSSIIYTS